MVETLALGGVLASILHFYCACKWKGWVVTSQGAAHKYFAYLMIPVAHFTMFTGFILYTKRISPDYATLHLTLALLNGFGFFTIFGLLEWRHRNFLK